jgi:hypothetical protein
LETIVDTPGAAAALARCRDEVVIARKAVAAGALDPDSLCGAVTQLAAVTAGLAELAGELGTRVGSDLSAAAPGTINEITTDLRTMATQLTSAKLLIEPAVADLAELTGTPARARP